MSFLASTSRDEALSLSRPVQSADLRLDALQPLLAGAHARGMADALELAGVAAVLIDAHGMVLHAGAQAAALFGSALRVEYDHLVGADGESTRAIQILLGAALGEGDLPAPLCLNGRGGGGLVLRVRRVKAAAGNLSQLLKVLILIEETAKDHLPAAAI